MQRAHWGSSVAIGNAAIAARIDKEASTTKSLKMFLGRYFYFCMSLVMAGLVVWGFSRTVDANLFQRIRHDRGFCGCTVLPSQLG